MRVLWRQILVLTLHLLLISGSGTVLAKETLPKAFPSTGYYMTFMRVQSMGLREWKQIVDCIREDGGNTLLLWMGGAFRSRKFPITWRYNQEHKNVRKDFVRALIDYAHRRGVKVLLCLTPFAYDGTNQYPIEHPELKATQKDDSPAQYWGMHSWGYNLCPAKPESQRFMLEYTRELLFDFYPNADGLMIESSDYAICYCSECRERFFDQEFRFVQAISQEVWKARPEATILVYPHYFNGRSVPGFGVSGAKQPFDPRWTLFFTPHSAYLDKELLQKAKTSIYWTEGLTLGNPKSIRQAVLMAKESGVTGYVPSLEPMSCPSGSPEKPGARVKPFHFFWLKEGQMPLQELLMRVNRIAYREYTRNPSLSESGFQQLLGREIFGAGFSEQSLSDLLFLQETYNLDASWLIPSPIVDPQPISIATLSPERRKRYQESLLHLKEIAERYQSSHRRAEKEMARIAEHIVKGWNSLP